MAQSLKGVVRMDEITNYDDIGARYEKVKRLPMGLAEQAAVLDFVGPLPGRSVLDVGCGTGFYPRLFRRLGAGPVVGVDASVEMIAYAKRVDKIEKSGIRYDIGDAAALPILGSFSVVTAVWLLSYATDEDNMLAMLNNLRLNTADDGKVIVVVPNPELDFDRVNELTDYGLRVRRLSVVDGRHICRVTVLGADPFDFDTIVWPPGAIENAMSEVGFDDIERWAPPPANDQSELRAGRQESLLSNTTFAVYRARPKARCGGGI